MVKSAAQIPTLKSQLLNIALYRFADTTDFLSSGLGSGNFLYQPTAVTGDFTYDDSGQATFPGFVNTTGVTSSFAGVAQGVNVPILTQTTATLPTNLTTPTGVGFTTSNSGGSLRPGTTLMGIAATDTSNRIGPITWIQVNYPTNGSTLGSVTLTWTPPAQSQNAYYVFKQSPDGNFYYTSFGSNGTSSYQDSTSAFGNIANQGVPASNTSSIVDPVTNLAVAYNTTGGSWSSPTYTFRVGAYNAIGDTIASSAVDAPFASPVNAVTMTTIAATATTGTGSLAAGTYYYRVAPFGPYTFTLGYESIAGNEVSATLSATGNINITWSTVANASGFAIYRGTSAGTETLLTTISGGGNTNFNDAGTFTPAVKYPPQVTHGAGFIATGSVTVNWTAVTGAAGYYVWTTRGANTLTNNSFNTYFSIAAGTTTFVYTGQGGTGSRYLPTYNYAAVNTGTSNITGVGRFLTAGGSSSVITRFGFTVALVSGKTYRWIVYSNNYGQPVNSTFVASSSAVQYYEYSSPFSVTAGGGYMYALVGQDSASYISWQPTAKPTTNDYGPNVYIAGEGGTFVTSFTGTSFSGNQPSPYGNSQSTSQPMYVKDDTLAGVPFKYTWRVSYTAANQITARGTVLGTSLNDTQTPMRFYTTNQTYATSVKSIVPTWSTAVPTNAYQQAQSFLNSRNVVEISTDAGATWTVVYLNQRYQFPSPVTQIMFRVTIPPRVATLSVVRGVTSPFAAGNVVPGYGYNNQNGTWGNYQMIADTGHAAYDYSAYNTNTQNGYFYADGFYAPCLSSNDRTYEIMGFQGYGHDVDAQVWCLPQGRSGGISTNFDSNAGGTASGQGGFWFGIDNTNANFGKILGTGSYSQIASYSGGVITGQYNLLRTIVNGSHILCFLNNRLVFDLTDTSYTAANYNIVGMRGSGGIMTGFQVANISSGQTNTQPWEFEFLSAYLET